ncbi:amino acid/polyamine/organocation transporter, APC superfamily [Candidatus Koribacter versatilis Ellin345]|uniref:Amino acid/polyamine/organocation transporter, APC superfamily n=1 Tax=Koribacter versatilis (strain Ellin345) TaxID=204669 RepID=Q1ILG4_KORVE|nr:amino acid permease [Candidatus Koribacter versatilis]ABF42286.1 amino acid/polyamine/organocation transporter, APC superfamily [Candidatus Koribacter versatilis Ellin345]
MPDRSEAPDLSTQAQVRSTAAKDEGFIQGLGLTSATTLVMGSMIGSGVYIVAADITRLVQSPALLIGAWLVTGFMTITAALAYGELAAMMPKAGGQYVYLREALGPLTGFLYGWTLFMVIQTGTIAAVGVAFGKFLGIFFPSISSSHWIWHIAHVPPIHIGPMVLGNMDVGLNTQNLMGILTIIFLSVLNVYGVKLGALVQNVFTFAKTAALLGLVVLGITIGRTAEAMAANFHGHFFEGAGWTSVHPVQVGVGGPMALVITVTVLAVAQVGSLFSADAWNNVTFTAGEVKNPQRNLPLSLAIGTGAVILLYCLANFVYLLVLPMVGDPNGTTVLARGIQHATEDRVATAVMQQIFGAAGAAIMAVLILISTFGCNNGLILSGARVYYAMAKDGLFFKSAGKLHPEHKTPAASLFVQCIWCCILCVSGSYGQLLDYIVFAVLIFYILTIVALFVLRLKKPDVPRPYRAIGYPILPAIYILMALFIDIVLLLYKPQYTWPGLIIVLLGIPVYFIWSRVNRATA